MGATGIGLIPAHAGKTAPPGTSIDARGAHPRSRGENSRAAPVTCTPVGSSPLTRGKLPVPSDPVPDQRLIPAHAGKTHRTCRPGWPHWAHPRSRGENPDLRSRLLPRAGSSPLTRGKLRLSGGPFPPGGLIPAHAGKTANVLGRSDSSAAHPRSRGENRIAVYDITPTGGSSPLTRGKLRVPG